MVREGIVHDVEKSGCYAILCNEKKALQRLTDWLLCCVSSISIADILAVLSRNTVRISMVKFQCYDGANVMSGPISGDSQFH